MSIHNILFREEMITSKWRLTLLIGICICMLFTASITSAGITFTEDSTVSGVGYVSVNKDFQTYPDDFTKNRVTTLVQHGTGSYDSEQVVRYRISELQLLGIPLYDVSSIRISEDTQLEYSPVSLDGINLSSKWYANLRNENHRLKSTGGWIGSVLSERYTNADHIEKDTHSYVNFMISVLKTNSQANGTTQIVAIVKDKGTGENIAELSECYVGNFTLNEKLKVTRPKPVPISLQLLEELLEGLLMPCP
jgi:hypothetical protein